MKLTELSEWHLDQLDKLAEHVEVCFGSEGTFEFFSGVPKLGNTKLKPTQDGFEVIERYMNYQCSKPYDFLTDYLHR